jgi:hypothetical protein
VLFFRFNEGRVSIVVQLDIIVSKAIVLKEFDGGKLIKAQPDGRDGESVNEEIVQLPQRASAEMR